MSESKQTKKKRKTQKHNVSNESHSIYEVISIKETNKTNKIPSKAAAMTKENEIYNIPSFFFWIVFVFFFCSNSLPV